MSTQPAVEPRHDRRQGHRALRGATMAYFVDMYDIYLPILVLAPALMYFIPSDVDLSTTSLIGGSIFAATLLGRPVGAFLFGHLADTVGRRRTTYMSVGGFGICTLLLGLLPGHQTWGNMAIVALIALRFLDGVFLGGEYTSANPLAMESAPADRRGLYSAVINCGFPLAYACSSLITLGLLHAMPSAGLHSAYVQWGWRIPFFLGALMSVGLLCYYRFAVEESVMWRESDTRTQSPIRELVTNAEARSGFGQVFLLMTGLWLSLQTISAILPAVLSKGVGLTSTEQTTILTISYLVVVPLSLLLGLASQRAGRRPTLLAAAGLTLTAAMAAYAVLIAASPANLIIVAVLATITVAIVDAPFAIMPAYINERFRLGVRSSGYGLAYSLSVVIPSFYAFYQQWLGSIMSPHYTVLVLLAIGGLLTLLGAWLGPETKSVNLDAVARTAARTSAPATVNETPRGLTPHNPA